MGKAIKFHNKKTGELLYPMTASDMVFDPTTKKSVKADLSEKIGDAPSDGKQYARQDGIWAEVNIPEGGISDAPTDGYQYVRKDNNWEKLSNDEICLINLASNQGEGDVSSLNGASIIVTYTEDGSEIYNGTWNSQTIMLYIPEGKEYKIVVGSVDGYTTPAEQTFTSEMFFNRNVVFTYNTELVRVTLSADDSSSVSGQVVTINGVEYTYGSTAVEQKIPFGTEYTVSVNDKSGYITPKSQTFTASESVRNLEVVYEVISYGVYILGSSGALYTKNSWNKQEQFNGFALISEEHEFAFDIFNYYQTILPIQSGPSGPIPAKESPLTDYDGYGNTALIKSLGYSSAAISYCKEYSHKGQVGYVPALGELLLIYENFEMVSELFEFVNGFEINTDYPFCSSTSAGVSYDSMLESYYGYMWVLDFETGENSAISGNELGNLIGCAKLDR